MHRETRSQINRALAKAVAYRDCGKPDHAARWAAKLVLLLEAEYILNGAGLLAAESAEG